MEITDGDVDLIENLINEQHRLAELHGNKLTFATLRDFKERVASHVLHPIMSLWICKNQIL